MNRIISKTVDEINLGYTYDSLGNVLTMTDQNGTTSYEYTENNLLKKITVPDNKTISYSYDLNGNVTGMTDYDGNTYSYIYDSANRLSSVQLGNDEIASYEYTVFDTIATVSTPEHISSYE